MISFMWLLMSSYRPC